MPNTRRVLLLCTMILSGCAGNETKPVPVAVSCPPPAPVPQILLAPVSTVKPLSVRFEDLWTGFETDLGLSLTKAQKP